MDEKQEPHQQDIKRPVGRPTDYNKEIAAKICDLIACGNPGYKLEKIDTTLPDWSTIKRWLGRHEDFRADYARAHSISAEIDFLEIELDGEKMLKHVVKQVDPKVANAACLAWRTLIDNKKWALSKRLPKKYGDKIDITSGNEPLDSKNQDTVLLEMLKQLKEAKGKL